MTDVLEMSRQGGPVLTAIALASVLAWVLIVSTYLELRGEVGAGLDWAPRVLERLSRDGTASAKQVLADRPGLLAPVLDTALSLDRATRRSFRAVVMPALSHAQGRLQRHLGVIASLGAATPLLGLLGTVLGMMQSFDALATSHGGDPSALADGISQALLTTQAGLVVALPVVLAHRHLRSRLRRFFTLLELHVARVEAHVCSNELRSSEVA